MPCRELNPENVLNHAIWYATMGYRRPYPGDSRVLTPRRVPLADDGSAQDREQQAAHR